MAPNGPRTHGLLLLCATVLAVTLGLALAIAVPAATLVGDRPAAAQGIISPRPTAEEFANARFSNPLVIDNSWTPIIPGTEFVLDGVVRERGKVLRHRIESLVTDMKKVVDGVPCVVVFERDLSKGKLQEAELFFAAQDDRHDVWLFGEYPELYDHGRFRGAPETWIAPTFGTRPGIFMYANPRVGDHYSQGFAPHIRFYDRARVLRSGLRICVPGRCFRNVLEIDEFAPYNPGDAHQRKFYARGFGTILATPAGGPQRETVSLAKVLHLDAASLAARRAGVLKTEARAYRVSDAYRQTPPAVPR
jgi:hypothetical protein